MVITRRRRWEIKAARHCSLLALFLCNHLFISCLCHRELAAPLQILFDSIHDVSNRLSSKDELKIRYHVVALLRRPLPFSLQRSVSQIVVGAQSAVTEAIDSP